MTSGSPTTRARPVRRPPTLVVGLGSLDRGDDAVGVHVARAVAGLQAPGVVVLQHEDPTDLLELWTGYEDVVIVDATRSGAAAGTVRVLEAGADDEPLPADAWGSTGRGGTHAFGLPAAIELARVLGRLPRRVTIVGVEAGGLEPHASLSPPALAALPGAVDAVRRAVADAGTAEEATAHVPR